MSCGKVRCSDMCPRLKLKSMRDLGPVTEAECEAAERRCAEDTARFNHREFVAEITAHPERLISWDSAFVSFEDYVRRVEAGEYD